MFALVGCTAFVLFLALPTSYSAKLGGMCHFNNLIAIITNGELIYTCKMGFLAGSNLQVQTWIDMQVSPDNPILQV